MVRANEILQTAQVTLLAMALAIPASLFGCSSAVTDPSLESLTGDPIEIAAMESEIADIMDMADIPGLSVAILNDSQVVYTHAFGLKDKKTDQPLDTSTVDRVPQLALVHGR
jgi:CubicO group peptidase (beta-lactamase class C family)